MELKFFYFAPFLLIAHLAAHWPMTLKKMRTENLKFRTDLWGWLMDGWSVTLQMIVYNGKLLKKSSYLKLKLVLSTLLTTWLSNIAFHLLLIWIWLHLIQNHARHCFQAFVCHHLKLLIYSNLSRLPFLGQVAFHLPLIGLQTLVESDSGSYQTSFPSFCAPPCDVAVLFNSWAESLSSDRSWT